MSSATVHHDTEIFGSDAHAFNPERWFDDTAQRMDRYMFQFGYGNRNCVGRNVGLIFRRTGGEPRTNVGFDNTDCTGRDLQARPSALEGISSRV